MRTPKPKPRPVPQDVKGKGKAKAEPRSQGKLFTINLRVTHRTAVGASRLHHIPMDVADSEEDGLNEDGEDIDPGKGNGDSESDGEKVSDKEQDDIGTLDARAVRARFKEEVCIGVLGVKTYILLRLKGADWGTADMVEDGSKPEHISCDENEEGNNDETPVSAKVNHILQIFLAVDTLSAHRQTSGQSTCGGPSVGGETSRLPDYGMHMLFVCAPSYACFIGR